MIWEDTCVGQARGAHVKLGRTASRWQEREGTSYKQANRHSFKHGHGNAEISYLLEPTVMKPR